MTTIDYLDDAIMLSPSEQELRLDYSTWLPDLIIDCHAHANGSGAVRAISVKTLKQVRASFPDFALEDSLRVKATLYVNKTVRTLRFGNPYKGIDHRWANAYLLANSPSTDRVALCGLPDDLNYTLLEMRSGKYAALKMYPFYFDPPAKSIFEFFPLPVLELAQADDIPIILHLPLQLSDCLHEVCAIAEQFPNLSIVLAHLGRHNYATHDSLLAYRSLASYPRIVADTSMATSADVLKQVFDSWGPERILFGTDEPFNLLRYVRYQHPELGDRLISTYPYHWLNEAQREEYGYLAKGAIHVHWQVLSSLRKTIAEMFSTSYDAVKQMIFANNAKRVFTAFCSP